jgi:hypothetical protein
MRRPSCRPTPCLDIHTGRLRWVMVWMCPLLRRT